MPRLGRGSPEGKTRPRRKKFGTHTGGMEKEWVEEKDADVTPV